MGRLRVMRFWVALSGVLLAVVIVAGDRTRPVQATAAVDPRIWDDIARGGSASFIVVLRNQPDLTRTAAAMPDRTARGQAVVNALRSAANATQPAVRSELDRLGARSRSYWVVNMLAVEGGRDAVAAMAARPDVLALESNRPFRAELEQPSAPASTDAPQAVEWNVTKIGAPTLWAKGVTGQGRIYANADTGVQWDHPALKPHYAGWNGSTADHNYAWWDAIHSDVPGSSAGNSCGGFSLPAPCDDYGHGTHTTGTAVGDDGAGNQVGVAPGAKWIACRNMDGGWGQPSTYIECLEFFLAPTDLTGQNPDPSRRPDAVGNSYGCPPAEGCAPTALNAAVNNMRTAGIFMAVSAGNNGFAGCSSVNDPPGLIDSAITVGSTDINDTIASSSSRGPVTVDGSGRRKPDISAPGVNVRSAYPPNTYGTLSGTSMAAPHVGAAVVLLWSALPHLRGQVDATEALLQQTAVPRTTTQGCGGDGPAQLPNNVYGYGRLDIAAAYALVTSLTGTVTLEGRTAASPNGGHGLATVKLDDGTPVSVVADGSFVLSLEGVGAGSHTLTACAPGYLCASRTIETGAGVPLSQPGPVQLPAGLVSADAVVNLHDVTAVLASFGQTPPNRQDGLGRWVDVNGDGTVNVTDVVLVIGNFGRRSPVLWP